MPSPDWLPPRVDAAGRGDAHGWLGPRAAGVHYARTHIPGATCTRSETSHRGDLDVCSHGAPVTQSRCCWVNTCCLDVRMFHGNIVEQMLWETSQSPFPAEEPARGDS